MDPMLPRRALLALVTAAALALVTAEVRVATATTVVPVTVETLARRSDAVLVVTPRSATPQWVGGTIVTDYDLEVQNVVQGTLSSGAHVTLRTPGGVVGRIGQQIPGVPSLETGRPYLVFLARDRDGSGLYFLAHLTAAVLPVVAAPDGTPVVLPALEGMRVRPGVVSTTVPHATDATAMVREGLPLEQLVRMLRGAP
jgi:hypothetical protein